MRMLLLLFVFTVLSCNEAKEKRNVELFPMVEINDTKEDVIRKMESKPDFIIEQDTIHLYQKLLCDLSTFIYKTPH